MTQTLLQKAKGRGRAMAAEIMVCTPAIRALIRDDKVHQIYSALQSGKKHGMQTMNDSLFQLHTSREVHARGMSPGLGRSERAPPDVRRDADGGAGDGDCREVRQAGRPALTQGAASCQSTSTPRETLPTARS